MRRHIAARSTAEQVSVAAEVSVVRERGDGLAAELRATAAKLDTVSLTTETLRLVCFYSLALLY